MTDNPYKLPEGNVKIGFSGGRTSGYMLNKILEANGDLPERCKVVFANTGREMPETLDFVQECSDRWEVPITWVEFGRVNNKAAFKKVNHNSASRNGEPFQKLYEKKTYLPNVMARICTIELKILPIKRYLVANGWTRWVSTIGIRSDENHRVKLSTDNRWTNWYPLNDASVGKHNVMDFWRAQPFDLKVRPGLGNCDGCFLKSEATLAALWRDHPERAQWWSDLENKVGTRFHKNRSYADLGNFVSRQSDWIFDDKAYLCQADHGECTG